MRLRDPRARSQSARGRRALELLLKVLEHHEGRAPADERYDVQKLRRELGMRDAR